MTALEPKTRLLSRHELSQALSSLDASEPQADAGEAKTRIWRRPSPAASRPTAPSMRTTEPVTELEVAHLLRAQASAKSSAAGTKTHRIQGLSPRLPALCVKIGLGILLIAAAAWLGALVFTKSEEISAKARVRAKSVHPPASAEVAAPPTPTPTLPSTTGIASPRAAVDQLISGRLREALDSYRALASVHADEPAFAFVVRQLEREIAACDKGDAPCAP